MSVDPNESGDVPTFKKFVRGMGHARDLFPLRPLGILIAGGAFLSLKWFASAEQDLVILVVGTAALFLVAIALTFVVVTALALKVLSRRRPSSESDEPLTFETSRFQRTGATRASMFWLPFVQSRVAWRSDDDVAVRWVSSRRGRLAEEVCFRRRGTIHEIERRHVIQDPFGLAQVATRSSRSVSYTVLPHVGAMRSAPLLMTLAGGEDVPHPLGVDQGDRLDLRRYAPGDPVRFIHWKVFARTRELVVRVPERALARSRRTVAYLIAGEGDEASSACARVAISSNAFGADWIFGADGSGECTAQPDALDAIVRSAAHQGETGLSAFLASTDRSGPSSAIVFAPARPGAWIDAVIRVSRQRPSRLRVVLGVDGLTPPRAPSLLRRALTRTRGVNASSADELDEVTRRLGSAVDVLVIDRVTGRVLGEAHRRQARRAA